MVGEQEIQEEKDDYEEKQVTNEIDLLDAN